MVWLGRSILICVFIYIAGTLVLGVVVLPLATVGLPRSQAGEAGLILLLPTPFLLLAVVLAPVWLVWTIFRMIRESFK